MTNQEKIDTISVLNQTIAISYNNMQTALGKAAADKIVEVIKTIDVND